jgi:hypothetical protein
MLSRILVHWGVRTRALVRVSVLCGVGPTERGPPGDEDRGGGDDVDEDEDDEDDGDGDENDEDEDEDDDDVATLLPRRS